MLLSGFGWFVLITHRIGRVLGGVDAYCGGEDMGKLMPLVSRHVGIVCDQVVGE